MATHSSILVWRIPGTEEPGRLESMGLQRIDTIEELSMGKKLFHCEKEEFLDLLNQHFPDCA